MKSLENTLLPVQSKPQDPVDIFSCNGQIKTRIFEKSNRMTMQLLLLSNSTNAGEEYLGWPREILKQFIEKNRIRTCLFVPYAGVTVTWDDYTTRVQDVFSLWKCKCP